MLRRLRIAFVLACALPISAHAHPHAWIYLETSPVFNAAGQMTALKQRWTFDVYYTEFILQDLHVKDRKNPPQSILMQLATTNLGNLKPYGYFTRVTQQKKPVAFGEVSSVASHVEKAALVMDFTLALATPLDVRAGSVEYKIFDPSYYVEMLHVSKKNIRLPENAPAGCTLTLREPSPDMTQISLASALDKQATAPDNLGDVFAETITLACP